MPSRTATVIRPDIAPGRRVLAISDIHGNLPFLKGVLAKAGYAAGMDVLVLVGALLLGQHPGQFQPPLLVAKVGQQLHPVHPHGKMGDGVGGGDDTVAVFLLK